MVSDIKIKAWQQTETDDWHITIVVPHSYVLSAPRAKPNFSHSIDMEQFFGMLEDLVCMKLGIEYPRNKAREAQRK